MNTGFKPIRRQDFPFNDSEISFNTFEDSIFIVEFRREETPGFLTPPSALEKPEQPKNPGKEKEFVQEKQQLPNIRVKSVDSEGVQLPLPDISYDWKESELSSSVMPAYLPRSGTLTC